MSTAINDQGTPATAPEDDERRQGARRRRVLKAGIIAFNGRHSTLPCTVRNISATGAHLRMHGSSASAPDTFELIVELDGLEASCTVMWRRGEDIGVRFEGEPRKIAPKRAQVVSAVVPAKAASLRRKPR
jgi:hypothetical protein